MTEDGNITMCSGQSLPGALLQGINHSDFFCCSKQLNLLTHNCSLSESSNIRLFKLTVLLLIRVGDFDPGSCFAHLDSMTSLTNNISILENLYLGLECEMSKQCTSKYI